MRGEEKINTDGIIYNKLKEAIRKKQILPKRQLVETTLAKKFGVSRTPVRQALKRLELEGYIIMVPNKGAFLAQPSLKEINDIFETRIVLEKKIISLASEKVYPKGMEELEETIKDEAQTYIEQDIVKYNYINKNFHLILAKLSGNTVLYKYMQDIFINIERFFSFYSFINEKKPPPSINAHKDIIRLITKKEQALAEQLMEEHIKGSLERLNLADIEEQTQPDYLSV